MLNQAVRRKLLIQLVGIVLLMLLSGVQISMSAYWGRTGILWLQIAVLLLMAIPLILVARDLAKKDTVKIRGTVVKVRYNTLRLAYTKERNFRIDAVQRPDRLKPGMEVELLLTRRTRLAAEVLEIKQGKEGVEND